MASNGNERKAIWHVLRELHKGGQEWIRNTERSNEARLAVERRFSPLNQQDLGRHLLHGKAYGNFGEQALYVKPPRLECGAAAAVWCKWNFANEQAACQFYLGLWLAEHRFVGFRFETPGSGDNHNYYHSQPCKTMGNQNAAIHGALAVPERNPAWPLAAKSALELLLCLVVSIHGMKGLSQMKSDMMGDSAIRQSQLLRKALEDLLAIRM